MPAQYTVSSAAALLSVSVSTVRRIADEFTGYLPDYQPLPGEARRLSTADVLTISAILTRLQSRPGLTRSALLRELSAPGSEPLVIPAELPVRQPQTAQDSPGRAIDIHGAQDSLAQSHTALQSLSTLADSMARLEARMEARIEGLQIHPVAERPADSLSLVAAAIAVGVLIGALVAAAVWPQNTAPVIVCIGVALCCLLFAIVYPLRR